MGCGNLYSNYYIRNSRLVLDLPTTYFVKQSNTLMTIKQIILPYLSQFKKYLDNPMSVRQ